MRKNSWGSHERKDVKDEGKRSPGLSSSWTIQEDERNRKKYVG